MTVKCEDYKWLTSLLNPSMIAVVLFIEAAFFVAAALCYCYVLATLT